MKTMHSLKFVLSTLMLLLVGAFAQAGIITNNFSSNFDFIANGVQGSQFDGMYIGNSDFPYQGTAAAQGNTTVANANIASNGTFTVTSQNTDFGDGPNDDGFLLYKVVQGDFSVVVQVVAPFNPAAFNEAGLQVRAINTTNANGRSTGATGQENWVMLARFDQFNFGNIGRTTINNGLTSVNPDPAAPIAPGGTNSLPIRIDRTGGTNFTYFQSVDGSLTNWLDITAGMGASASTRADFAGLPLQVGLHHSTFNDNAATPTVLSARFANFSITSTDFDAWSPAPTAGPTALTVTTNLDHNMTVSWTPGTGSSNTLVVLYQSLTGTNANNYLRYAPANGFTYGANNVFGGAGSDSLLTSNINFVIYNGSGSSVIVSNLIGGITYRAVAYAFNSNGVSSASANYFRSPATASFVSAAIPTNLTLTSPTTPVVVGSSRVITATVQYDTGSLQDVTASALLTYGSTNAAVATVLNTPTSGKGRLLGLSVGSAAITATYTNQIVLGTNTNNINLSATNASFTVVNGQMTHRWSFNEPTLTGGVLTTNVSDSIGGANGQLIGGNTNSGQEILTWPGNGQLQFDGAATYVQLPGNLFTNNGSFTAEAWVIDSGGPAARLLDAGSDTAHLLLFSDNVSGSINAGNGATTVTGSRNVVSNGSLHQVVWTQGGAGRRYSIYVDGLRTAINTNALLTPEQVGAEPIITIGKGQNNAFFLGAMDELRTYNYELDNLSVAAHAGYGVAVTNNDPGNLSSLVMTLPNGTNMTQDDTQTATVTATFSGAGSINVTSATNVSFSSANTNVVTISSNALVTAILPGDTSISAVGVFPLSSPTTMTSTLPIHVSAVVPALQHRWSFNNDVVDSMTAIPASPFNIGFTNINGQNMVVIQPTNLVHASSYIQLPNDLLIAQSSVTFEVWYTETSRHLWNRVWDIGNNTGTYMSGTTMSSVSSWRTLDLIPGNGGERNVNVDQPPIGAEHHVVYAVDGTTRIAKLYMDGVMVGQNTNDNVKPRSMGSTANDFLGRSQFGGDPDFEGFINEFRIYNYPFSDFQALINNRNPDDAFVFETNVGALGSMTISLATNSMPTGGQQQAQALANWANATNVQVQGVASWTSSAPGVLKVSTNGTLTAVAAGSATVTAVYSNQTATSASITVTNRTTPIIGHRYSFTGDLTDSVGGANGTNVGTATVTASNLVLSGNTATNSYVRLPGHLFDGYGDVTFEIWAAQPPTTAAINPANNTRLLDFGSDGFVNPPVTNNWFGFTTVGINTSLRWVYNVAPETVNAQHSLQSFDVPIFGSNIFNHYAWSFDSLLRKVDLYVNGYKVSTWPMDAMGIGPPLPNSLTNDMGFIGHRVQAGNITNFTGTIDEFRIWQGALDQVQVQTSLKLGPDAVNPLDSGALNALHMTLNDPTVVLDTIQLPQVTADYANVSNVDLTGYPGVAISSSDTNKIVVLPSDSEGITKVRAIATGGPVNLIASFGGKTVTNTVTVVPHSLVLTHRYNFQNDVTDLIGKGDGKVFGNVTLSNGQAVFTGQKVPNTYIKLPRDIIAGYKQVTIETWFSSVNGDFSRVWDFGSLRMGDNQFAGNSYLYLAPAGRSAILPMGQVETPGISAPTSFQINSNNARYHVIVTVDSLNNTQVMYTNGVTATNLAQTNVYVDLTKLDDKFSVIGRSPLFNGDPSMVGTVDEMRIYYGVMDAATASNSFAIGPNPEQLKAVADGLGNVVVSWGNSPQVLAGYVLQTNSSVVNAPGWANVPNVPVTNGNAVSVTLPAGQTQLYFRLKR